MAERALRKLKRRDLLQMLLTQCEETERLQKELDETTAEYAALQEGYERLKDKLNVKDERLNQKDAAIAELKTTIEDMRASRLIELEESGNIAEAALRINGIFEAAQRCAEQYLLNVKRLSKNAFEKVAQEERMELPGESLMPEEIEEHEQLAVPEQRPVPRTFTITDRRGTRGQRISYESGWKTAARRKKLHG